MQKLYITLFVASLLICSFAFNLSADTPQIRVSIGAKAENGDDAPIVSALSREFRKLDGVRVTDTQPALKITCVIVRTPARGYAASVAVTDADNHIFSHFVQLAPTIDQLAHAIAISLDGSEIEKIRRAPQPSSSP